MRFEFDQAKNEINKAKHGVSFEQIQALWTVYGIEYSLGMVNGEFRYMRIGKLRETYYSVVYSYRRGSDVRLISARQASPREISQYEQDRK